MTYSAFFSLIQTFKKSVDNYAIDNNQLNDYYFVAKNWLDSISEKCSEFPEYKELVGVWLQKGGTLMLKDLLVEVNYKDSDLVQFNAFDLLDSVSLSFQQPITK